uniref:28S ribosomal protein S10, mitochondrial isoform X2 n=1 Tax=Myodes glareolus TaxID=447135 RepID=UPI002021C559|nr:28S ribosomal protein S10, mitochondrial isoform X2 [Myodes glareolus]
MVRGQRCDPGSGPGRSGPKMAARAACVAMCRRLQQELGTLSVSGPKSSTAQTGGLLLTSKKWAPWSNLHMDVPKDLTKPMPISQTPALLYPRILANAHCRLSDVLGSACAIFHAIKITVSDEPDTLYKRVSILVKAHDKAVLDSYEYFAVLAAKELGISINVHEPPRKIERLTLLKSVHIFKKHRVQYEMRTLYRHLELKHLTGCTANVYLEYIQRNLPEGVAMEVTKTQIQQLPEHIKEPMWETLTEEKEERTS